jgi:hypothetical protein
MEYILGSLITLAVLSVSARAFKVRELAKPVKVKVSFNQTRKLQLIQEMLPYIPPEHKPVISQASKHRNDVSTKVMFIDDTAYWIENGSLHEAVLDNNGINMETKKTVDIMSMDDVELKKMIFVVEKLTEGRINDSGTSGN